MEVTQAFVESYEKSSSCDGSFSNALAPKYC